MELRDRDGDLFTHIAVVNDVYPVRLTVIPPNAALAAWTIEGDEEVLTHEELVEHLEKVAMVTTAKGADDTRAMLMTWDRRLGHLSFKTVVALAKNGAKGIQTYRRQCPVLMHVLHALQQKRSTSRIRKGAIVWSSTWVECTSTLRDLQVKSAGGKEYKYIAVEDYSHAVYTCPLKHKSDAPEAFKIFKAAAKRVSSKQMHKVMTDNARELCMGEMKEICEKEGIKLHTLVQYSPESNGVAERMIGVLTNVVRAMLHNSGLPKFLWAEAFNAATYVHNRTLTKVLGGRMPFEVLYGAKPGVSHLRAFGAPCAIIKPKERLRKLDDQAMMCFFVGYKYKGGGYQVWDPKK